MDSEFGRSIAKVIGWATMASFFVAATGCSHVVTIDSEPTGAEIYVDGMKVGNAPVQYTEKTGWAKAYRIEARKKGYTDTELAITQTEWNQGVLIGSIGGAVALLFLTGGILSPLPLIGLIWAQQLPDRVVVPMNRGGRKKSSGSKAPKKETEDDNYDYGY